jgi:hypothetical protein
MCLECWLAEHSQQVSENAVAQTPSRDIRLVETGLFDQLMAVTDGLSSNRGAAPEGIGSNRHSLISGLYVVCP